MNSDLFFGAFLTGLNFLDYFYLFFGVAKQSEMKFLFISLINLSYAATRKVAEIGEVERKKMVRQSPA